VSRNKKNDPFDSPPIEEIPTITAMHVEAMDQTESDEVWLAAGMNLVLLETVGRKSGRTHRVALPYWLDSEEQRIVVASYAGGPRNPAWFHNVADSEANPTVRVQERAEVWDSQPEVLTGADYDTVWADMVLDRSYYIEYQAKTERQIPLVRLPKF
jgi:deazaflavin-dependent oxidoreductase (nitroreductase family)